MLLEAFIVLQHCRIPEAVVSAVSARYDNSKSVVTVNGNISDSFEVSTDEVMF